MDRKEADQQEAEMMRQRLLLQLEEGFVPDPKITETQLRQTRALEFIAFALGELVRDMRQSRGTKDE